VRRRRRIEAVAAVAGALAGTGYALHSVSRRWRAEADALGPDALALPRDVGHHVVEASDGGRLHTVERGAGPPLVLVHGVTLAAGVWAPQLAALGGTRRVIAVDLRGHGESVAGTEGYAFDRMADDLLEVMAARRVAGATLVGHSMGGMVTLTAGLHRRAELHRHVDRLVLVATPTGPTVPGPLGVSVGGIVAAAARGALGQADRRGAPVVPPADLAAWLIRLSFGSRPDPADMALARSMLAAMSPGALAGLIEPLFTFDVRDELASIDFPTTVVAGRRDLLVAMRTSRHLAAGIPGAGLHALAGCGHMIMLERAEELNELLARSGSELRSAAGVPR